MRGGGHIHINLRYRNCGTKLNIDEEEMTDIMYFICLELQQACCLLTLENILCKGETS